jgi:hypothetical protein
MLLAIQLMVNRLILVGPGYEVSRVYKEATSISGAASNS